MQAKPLFRILSRDWKSKKRIEDIKETEKIKKVKEIKEITKSKDDIKPARRCGETCSPIASRDTCG